MFIYVNVYGMSTVILLTNLILSKLYCSCTNPYMYEYVSDTHTYIYTLYVQSVIYMYRYGVLLVSIYVWVIIDEE